MALFSIAVLNYKIAGHDPAIKETYLLFTSALASAGRLTALAAIIHAWFTATLCTLAAMVHFAVTAWGISRFESKGCNGEQHHYSDEKKTSHDF